MGQTVRQTKTYEVVLAVEDCSSLASGHERKLCGDIIGFRPVDAPQAGMVGSAERNRYVWVLLELTDEEAGIISQPVVGGVDQDGRVIEYFDKRRYCIPLERLEKIVPSFNPARAKDSGDIYQPFCLLDEDPPWQIMTRARPLGTEGLVFDKVTGGYL